MERNVGGYDRIGRLIIGAALVIAGIAGYAGLLTVAVGPVPQALGAVLLLIIGAILLVTGWVQQCPLWALGGVNTFRRG